METKETFLPYGIITGLILVVMNAAFIATDLELNTGVSLLIYIPLIAGLILNAIAFSKANNGYITYGKAYMSCFKAGCVIAVIGAIWAAVAPFVFPDMIDKVLEVARQKMSANGAISESAMDMGMKMARTMMKFSFIVVLIGDIFWAALISLIAAAIAKKTPYTSEPVSHNAFGGPKY